MLNHDDYIERFSAFLDDDLEAAEATCVKEHLADCRACTAHFELFRRAIDGLHALPRHPAPPDLARKVRRRVRRRIHDVRGPYRSGYQEFASAAVLAVLVGSAVAVSSRLLSPGSSDLEPLQTVTSLGGPDRQTANAPVQAWTVVFRESHREAATAFVSSAADFGARDLEGQPIRPGQDLEGDSLLLVVPEPALSLIVPEGVAQLEQVPEDEVAGLLAGEHPEVGSVVPRGWVLLRIVVR